MKDPLDKLFQTMRGKRPACWPWSRAAERGAALPGDRTGWTVHGDIALRLKQVSAGAHEASGGEIGTFKIRLAGTVSLRLDSPEGLAADGLYRAEIDAIRRDGLKVCECTRLAVDTSRLSQPVLAGLFHTVYLFARRIRDFDVLVIEVKPRHVGFYHRSLGFEVVGDERHNARVGAPAVLPGMPFSAIADHLRRHAGGASRGPAARGLYAHGFSAIEEAGVLFRLRALGAGPAASAGFVD
jgi:hypothetical protein